MATIQIQVQAQNAFGLSSAVEDVFLEITGGGVPLPPILDSVDVSPTNGTIGTLFTITINARDVNDPPSPLTYRVVALQVEGGAFLPITPTAQPNVFTFVWQP